MDFDLSHYDSSYYAIKKKEYEQGKAWKIEPFFDGLQVRDKTVLDYGSAAGNMAREAVKRQAGTVVAYDPIYDDHAEIVDLVKSEGIDFVTTKNLRSIDDKFDLIFCSDVIEHVVSYEIESFVGELLRFAHDQSVICLNSPVKINLACLTGSPLASATQGHINVMNPWKVKRIFGKFGFLLQLPPMVLGVSKKPVLRRFGDLPYPLNCIWGGHYFMRFASGTNAG